MLTRAMNNKKQCKPPGLIAKPEDNDDGFEYS
jgi:hypothetical protein